MLASIRAFLWRILHLNGRKKSEAMLDGELEFHLQMEIEQNLRQGMNHVEARRRALIAFGGLEQVREGWRETRGFSWLSELRQDFGYGFRSLRKNAVWTSIAVVVLALGIGANTGVLTLIDVIVFRPLPVQQPDHLIELSTTASLPDFIDIEAGSRGVSALAAYSGLPLFAHTGTEGLSGRTVTANFFDVLGAKMAAGRGFLPGEADFPSGQQVAVISYRLWERSYARDPGVIGRAMQLNGVPVTIVGVTPRNFRDVALAGPYQDLWLPLPMYAKVMHIEQSEDWKAARQDRGLGWLGIIGRLNPGIRFEQAKARIEPVLESLKKDYPRRQTDWNPMVVSGNRNRWPGGNILFASTIITSAGLCVLLIACTNVAGLLLARGSGRQKEIATRLALGASRARIVRQLLVEGLLLSALGLIAGLAVCALTLRMLPELEGTLGSPLDLGLSVDLRSIAIAAAIALLSTLLFALAPALVASRAELTGALKDQGFFNFSQRRLRGRRILVAFQVLLSFILLVGAGLFARTILYFESVDPGFDRNVLLLKSDFLSVGFDRSKGMDFYRRSLDRIRELPGVRAASWAEDLPFEQFRGLWEQIQPELENDKWLRTDCNAITTGYFETNGIPILQGRDFSDHDFQRSAAVVLVNETMARRYWPQGAAVGKRIRVRSRSSELYEIIGVVADAKYRTPWQSQMPYLYFPFWHHLFFHMDLHVSASGDARTLAEPIRKACQAVNPGVTITSPRLMSAQVDSLLSQERSAGFMLTIFGGLALIMAAAGLYGIVSYSVARRSQEFGIRMAIGASGRDILRQVMSEGIMLALSGIAIGLPCSVMLARFLVTRLHGLNPIDPITYCAISVLCIAVAAMAVLIPARRATANPTQSLRCE